jgi:proteasome accessory factor B
VTDAVERILNLALHFAHASSPTTAEEIRRDVAGYPTEQDDAAFARMFERDKDELRRAGLTLVFDEEDQTYSLDIAGTFAGPVTLSDEEAAAVRVAGSALLQDPSFPFSDDLRLALTKIASQTDDVSASPSRLADEEPGVQGESAGLLARAVESRKLVSFGYTNSSGRSAPHEVEAYGLFLHDGRWYLVGRDASVDEVRTYAVTRMESVRVNERAPRSADFIRPADFDVSTYVRLPFQYGPDEAEFEAEIRFSATSSWRAPSLAAGHGDLHKDGDEVLWRVSARSEDALMRFTIENGPGLSIVRPPNLRARLESALDEVEALHA